MATMTELIVRNYASLVKNGRWNIEKVPAEYRTAVQDYIKSQE